MEEEVDFLPASKCQRFLQSDTVILGVVWCGVVWCGVVWCVFVCVARHHQINQNNKFAISLIF